MPFTFQAIQPGLLSLFASLAPDTQVSWWNQPRAFHQGQNGNGQLLDLQVTGMPAIGTDAQLSRYDATAPTGAEMVRTVEGTRQLLLQADAWTLSEDLGASALAIAESVRTRLRSAESVQALKALGLSIVETGNLVRVPDRKDGRTRYRWSLPITLEGVFAVETQPTTYIERVIAPVTLSADGDETTVEIDASAA